MNLTSLDGNRIGSGVCSRQLSGGQSLIELMVSISLGAFVMIGLMNFVGSSSVNFAATANLARLHDAGRAAVAILGDEIRRSGFWGGLYIENTIADIVQGSSMPITPSDTLCPELGVGRAFAAALDRNLHGTNNVNAGYACLTRKRYIPSTDLLTVRYVSPQPADMMAPKISYLRVAPLQARLFLGEDSSRSENKLSDVVSRDHEIIARSYFIGDTGRTCAGNRIPALFQVTLHEDDGTPIVRELLPGIEQLQVQYLEQGRYRNANQVSDWTAVEAVQFWVSVRSICPESGGEMAVVKKPPLVMGDFSYDPGDDSFRRKVFQTVIAKRNKGIRVLK